jgi:hypothetical protein
MAAPLTRNRRCAESVDRQNNVWKGHAMTNPNDPDYRRELVRETNEEGMSTATWAGIAVAAMIIGGIAMYAFSTHESNVTASKQPNIEQSAPPATTGQGGTQSKMPAEKDKAE